MVLMKIAILTMVLSSLISAIKPPSANFLQLEPTDLQLASRAEVALSEREALTQTEIQAESQRPDGYGWSSLLIPSNLVMAVCGSILIMFVIPMTWLNERKNARIYYVLTRAMEEVIAFQSCN